jgi:hypothetical protein
MYHALVRVRTEQFVKSFLRPQRVQTLSLLHFSCHVRDTATQSASCVHAVFVRSFLEKTAARVTITV